MAKLGAPESRFLCHAPGCGDVCPPEHLLCRFHWRLVPDALRRLVWAHYSLGQFLDRKPTRAWACAVRAAIHSVSDPIAGVAA